MREVIYEFPKDTPLQSKLFFYMLYPEICEICMNSLQMSRSKYELFANGMKFRDYKSTDDLFWLLLLLSKLSWDL